MAEAKARGPYRVLIAGGGTGGHLFPGLAIAEAFLARHPDAVVRFAGSRYGIEQRIVPEHGYVLYRIPVRALYGVSLGRRLWVLAMAPLALARCLWVLVDFRPNIVIGVGGYASGPMLATALLTGRLTVLQEQNAYPGLTNRWLGRFVRLAFVPFTGLERFFPRAIVTGNPVRAAIMRLRDDGGDSRPSSGSGAEAPMVFVFGGSQGARRINEAMMEALPLLAAWKGGRTHIFHQTGSNDHGRVAEAYAQVKLSHEAHPFVEDMAGAYRRARLVVSRAGASAISEIVTARRASLLIPIPGTSGEHQLKNAQRLERVGAAVILEQKELTGPSLAARIIELLEDPARLDAMETATDALYTGDAATRIAEACEELMVG